MRGLIRLNHWVYGLCITALAMASAAQGQDEYGYPYKDPYMATFSSALLKGRNKKQGVSSQVLNVAPLPGRDHIDPLSDRGYLSCRLYVHQDKVAPLMIIVPGLGSSAHIGNGTFLADQFYLMGFHALVVPSPLNWNFALTASESGLPGVTPEDAADLRRGIHAALKQIREDEKVQISKIGMVSISLGGLETAYLAALEQQSPALGISRYLVINPAVDLKHGIARLDQLSSMVKEVGGPARAKEIADWAMDQLSDSVMDGDPTDPAYFADVDKRFPFKHEEFQFLIGTFIKAPISEALYVSQLIDDRGLLTADLSHITQGLQEARRFGAMEYVEKFVYPHFSERLIGSPITVDELMARSSLPRIEKELRAMTEFYVMENEDDFLLRSGDLDWMRGVFGSRLKVYPLGGHVGNIWYDQNKKDILSTFADWNATPSQNIGDANR